jgi:hypothetical protein
VVKNISKFYENYKPAQRINPKPIYKEKQNAPRYIKLPKIEHRRKILHGPRLKKMKGEKMPEVISAAFLNENKKSERH